MPKKISDIKVLQPGDKLVVKCNGGYFDRNEVKYFEEAVHEVLNNPNLHCLFIDEKLEVYILKEGATVLLKDHLNSRYKRRAEKCRSKD